MAELAMPRPKTENTGVVNLKLPPEWLDEAQDLARDLSKPGVELTRADALRLAIRRGIDALRAETPTSKPRGRK